jgi:hypothetical protein
VIRGVRVGADNVANVVAAVTFGYLRALDRYLQLMGWATNCQQRQAQNARALVLGVLDDADRRAGR